MILKFFMYQAHYRNTLDISNDALLAAEKGFEKIKSLNKDINEILSKYDLDRKHLEVVWEMGLVQDECPTLIDCKPE